MHLIQAEADNASTLVQGLKQAIMEMVTSHMLEDYNELEDKAYKMESVLAHTKQLKD